MFEKKIKTKDKVAPFAAGVAVTAGAVVGVAAAKALSDKKTRKQLVKGFNSAKKQAVTTVSGMVEKRGEMMDMVMAKAKDVLPQKTQKKVVKKVTVAKMAAVKKVSTASKSTTKPKTAVTKINSAAKKPAVTSSTAN